jgi:putative tryptophan/tyrosine transport system substrate-binding protein
MPDMKRRAFISLIGGAAAAWPIAAQAQQARTPVLGFLGSAAEADYKTTTTALRRGLNEAGYVEKKNLLIDYRWADFQYERLPALAAELVKRPVDAIFATGSVVSALAPNRRRRPPRSCSPTAAIRSNMGWSPA